MADVLSFPSDALVERLEHPFIKLVAIAPDLTAARTTPPRIDPAIFVVLSTTGGPLMFSGVPVKQPRKTSITLVTWVKNHGSAQDVRKEMDQALAAVDSRLAGWTEGDEFGSPRFVASRDEFSHGQWLVTQTVYEVEWTFSATPLV